MQASERREITKVRKQPQAFTCDRSLAGQYSAGRCGAFITFTVEGGESLRLGAFVRVLKVAMKSLEPLGLC